MIDGQFAVAFAAGLVAVANPCGFAMLPAYLSFFVGVEGQGEDARAGVSRALAVSLTVSAGFVATFAVITAVIRNLAYDIRSWSPWISVAIGVVMVGMGIWLLSGRDLPLRLPRLDRGGRTQGWTSMFVYGVSYAVVSLGCALGPFLSLVVGTVNAENWISASLVFVAYALGFTVLLTSLTVGVALARRGVLASVRRSLPYIQRVSGAFMVIAGAYVVYYGLHEEYRIDQSDPIVDRVTSLSNDVAVWVTNFGPVRLGLLLTLVVAAAAIAVATRRRSAA